jgi:hypothetical protein
MILAGNLMKIQHIPPSEAINILKSCRKLIMIPEQILLLKKYYGMINSAKFKSIKTVGFLMLVGLPCSGKSTFAMELVKNLQI